MKVLKPRIHENGIDYILAGDYYVPDLKLSEEKRPIGHWGRLQKAYLQTYRPTIYNELVLSCWLHSVLADLNEQANDRFSLLMEQMAKKRGRDRTDEGGKSDVVGTVYELHPQPSRGNHQARTYLCMSLFR